MQWSSQMCLTLGEAMSEKRRHVARQPGVLGLLAPRATGATRLNQRDSAQEHRKKPEAATDQDILDYMIKAMERKVIPWRRHWSDPNAIVIGGHGYQAIMWPSNLRTPKVPFGLYNGVILLTRVGVRGYRTNLWLEKGVSKELGAKFVKVDDQPVSFLKYPDLSKPDHAVRRNEPHDILNLDQIVDCEKVLGLSIRDENPPPIEHKDSEQLLGLLKRDLGLNIVPENRAAYSPMMDVLTMPEIGRFHARARDTGRTEDGEAHYWATLWHEVVHWTGHSSRLDRPSHRSWGDATYAFEELVAELGATFPCACFGIDGDEHHESFLEAWCRMLQPDRGASLRKAASFATPAKDFISTKERPAGTGKRSLPCGSSSMTSGGHSSRRIHHAYHLNGRGCAGALRVRR